MYTIIDRRKRKVFVCGEIPDMLIEDNFLKTVAFLTVEKQDDISGKLIKKPCATVFFVEVPINAEVPQIYAVTARHVIENIHANTPIHIRVNNFDGSIEYLEAKKKNWVLSDKTDIAVISFEKKSNHKIQAIPCKMLATDAIIRREETGIGDEIFFVGLFSEHYGQEHNLPVVRFGNISLMPAEKLSVRVAEDSIISVNGYLVEAMSWPGHSGSPVFIYYPFDREPGTSRVAVFPLKEPDPLSGTEQFKLLGLVSAHYPIEQEVKMSDTIPKEQRGRIYEQAGMAVVIPAQGIIDTLNEPDLVEDRKQTREKCEKGRPTAIADGSSTTISFTKDDFVRDLKKVSQKKPDGELS